MNERSVRFLHVTWLWWQQIRIHHLNFFRAQPCQIVILCCSTSPNKKNPWVSLHHLLTLPLCEAFCHTWGCKDSTRERNNLVWYNAFYYSTELAFVTLPNNVSGSDKRPHLLSCSFPRQDLTLNGSLWSQLTDTLSEYQKPHSYRDGH